MLILFTYVITGLYVLSNESILALGPLWWGFGSGSATAPVAEPHQTATLGEVLLACLRGAGALFPVWTAPPLGPGSGRGAPAHGAVPIRHLVFIGVFCYEASRLISYHYCQVFPLANNLKCRCSPCSCLLMLFRRQLRTSEHYALVTFLTC